MSRTPAIGGPVSAFLEADLRTWVLRHGIVVWLDLDDRYTAFVDRLAEIRADGGLPYEVQAYRGSHLELMLRLEPCARGAGKTPLVIHLPGFNEESVRETPLLELYLAGARYRKRMDTLVTDAAAGRVPPAEIAAFRERTGLDLANADAWLAALLDGSGSALAAQLGAMSLPAMIDDLLMRGDLATRAEESAGVEAIWSRLEAATGLPEAWRENVLPPSDPSAEDMAFAAAAWALCVEYADDLQRPPVDPRLETASTLPHPVINDCRALAAHLRGHHPVFYRRTADETEALLVDEVSESSPESLSGIDTFRFEEARLLEASLAALAEGDWKTAAGWAERQLTGGSFWLRDDPSRQAAWELVESAALLGQAILSAGQLDTDHGMEAAIECYAQRGAAVDQAHRNLEQRRWSLLQPPLPEFESLRERLDRIRKAWRTWADEWACAFNALCRADGFLPPVTLQQRQVFEELVRPLIKDDEPTAYFLVDAFRFEMAQELYCRVTNTPATNTRLRACLAELPTVTEVGMNVLAPVVDGGKLHPTLTNGRIQGFSTGEFRVSNPDTRKRAIQDRVGGATCPWLSLEEVVNRDSVALKRSIARARLVVVHSREIDSAGEQGAGLPVFAQIVQRLSAAWSLLREAGVKRFVFAADHGFLLLDNSTRSIQSHGRRIDPHRRHVFSNIPADHNGEVRVALSDLGYEGTQQQFLMFPETTAVFDTGKRPMSFVHGGNSLQERVVPVLTIVHRTAAGGSTQSYVVTATVREDVADMHSLEVKVEPDSQLGLDFDSATEVELALRVPEAPNVSVEVCQTRGSARPCPGGVTAEVDKPFELFFRLSGASDVRVRVELYHPSGQVELTPYAPETRFTVAGSHTESITIAEVSPAKSDQDWLTLLPEGGVRELFRHLAEHGAVTETEAAGLLGGPRHMRRFARRFEEIAAKVPFGVRIDVVAGVKRYVREGSQTS